MYPVPINDCAAASEPIDTSSAGAVPSATKPTFAFSSSERECAKPPRGYTSKQLGDAAEMLVAAELTLAGTPALKVPDLWPGYDVIAQPRERSLQRISVKARAERRGNFVVYNMHDEFDWLAAVLIPDDGGARRIYIIPRDVSDARARRDRPGSKTAHQCFFEPADMDRWFAAYLGNFRLERKEEDDSPETRVRL